MAITRVVMGTSIGGYEERLPMGRFGVSINDLLAATYEY